ELALLEGPFGLCHRLDVFHREEFRLIRNKPREVGDGLLDIEIVVERIHHAMELFFDGRSLDGHRQPLLYGCLQAEVGSVHGKFTTGAPGSWDNFRWSPPQ